jgi:UDP-arabinose 4-epimerase
MQMKAQGERRDTVLVTGGAGYIGSHACKALARAGYLPVTYDNLSTGNAEAVRWGPLERGDILDRDRLEAVCRAHRPVAVLHFAALALVGESMEAPHLYYRTNVTGVTTLLDACRAQGIDAFVFSSTCAVYGTPADMPISRGDAAAPINPYGASKLMAEQIIADYGRAYGIRHAALRYFNAAGADPDGETGEDRPVETHLIPLALDAILGLRPPLKVLGDDYPTPDGTAIRDYIHVSDLAEAHVAALERLLGGAQALTLNLGTGRGHSVREVLAAAAGRRAAGPARDRAAPARRSPELVADPGAARSALGEAFVSRSDLATILETAWRWHTRPDRRSGAA